MALRPPSNRQNDDRRFCRVKHASQTWPDVSPQFALSKKGEPTHEALGKLFVRHNLTYACCRRLSS